MLSIDGHRLVAPQGGERTVSSAALNLLRTLVHDHTLESPVTEGGPLFPCCGFNVWVAGERFRVLISGCPAREGLTRALPTHGIIQETPKRHQTDDGELTCVKALFRLHTLFQSSWTLETLMSCAMSFRRLFFVIGLGFFAFVGKAQSEEEIYSLLDDTVPARAAVTTMRQHAPGVVLAENYVQPKVQDIAKASVNVYNRRTGKLELNIPGTPLPVVSIRHFDPVAGFTTGTGGELIIDPSAADADLEYYAYGVAQGIEVTVYASKGHVSAAIQMNGTYYSIDPVESGHVLRQLDANAYPGDEVVEPSFNFAESPLPPAKSATRSAPAQTQQTLQPESTDVVTVLVLYTPNALSQVGATAMSTIVPLMIQQTNTAFANSHANTVMLQNANPSGQGFLVNYDESPGISNDSSRWTAHLNYVRNSSEIQALRNQLQADVIALITGDHGLCGKAWVQRHSNWGPVFETKAVSAIKVSCATASSQYSFAHELGHNFGMEHDRFVTDPSVVSSFPWSFGYIKNISGWQGMRTLMAYVDHCASNCPKYLQYSNPEVGFTADPDLPSGNSVPDPATSRYEFGAITVSLAAKHMSEYRGPSVAGRIFRSGFEAYQDYPHFGATSP